MKFILIVWLCLSMAIALFGCVSTTNTNRQESVVSDASDIEESTTDTNKLFEKYPFLKSKYTVTAKSESQKIRYTYTYYFEKDTVAGMRQMVSFPAPESARKYYTDIVTKCPEATINASTVTYYVGEDAYCYGFSLDKLKFQLENVSFEYTINFDEEEFSEKFEQQKAKSVTPKP